MAGKSGNVVKNLSWQVDILILPFFGEMQKGSGLFDCCLFASTGSDSVVSGNKKVPSGFALGKH